MEEKGKKKPESFSLLYIWMMMMRSSLEEHDKGLGFFVRKLLQNSQDVPPEEPQIPTTWIPLHKHFQESKWENGVESKWCYNWNWSILPVVSPDQGNEAVTDMLRIALQFRPVASHDITQKFRELCVQEVKFAWWDLK